MDTSHIFRPIIDQAPGRPDPTSGDAADLARLDEDRWKHGAIIDMHAEALEVERRRQVLAWLEHRGVGLTPTPGTVRRGVELDHADALAAGCPDCLAHPGWAHPDESRRAEPSDVCRGCLGSGSRDVWEALRRARPARPARPAAVVAPQLVSTQGDGPHSITTCPECIRVRS